MRIVKVVLSVVDIINEKLGRLDAWLSFALTIVILIGVIARYLINIPLSWPHETSIFIFGAYFILAGGYVLLHEGHVNVDIFYVRFSKRRKALVDLFTWMFFFLFCGVLLWQTTDMAWHSLVVRERTQSVWGPPVYPIKLVLVIAVLLLLLQGISKFARTFYLAITGKEIEGRAEVERKGEKGVS